MALYYLFESATGYALFVGENVEEIAGATQKIQESITSLKRFKKIVKLTAFFPFDSSDQAFENMHATSQGQCHKDLVEFLKMNMPSTKKSKYKLAVEDSRVPNSLSEYLPKLPCVRNEMTLEVHRGIRLHFTKLVKEFDLKNLSMAQLGLAHAFSRSKVQSDVKRHDKHIIHAIALLDQLDKDINTFAMRLKEWYSWHFPELYRIISENITFAKSVKLIQNKKNLNEDMLGSLAEVVGNDDLAKEVLSAGRSSMGGDMNEVDTIQINHFTDKILNLAAYREEIANYLKSRMSEVAPNLSALIGEIVGARLISQAGGLHNLAKYPASTVQILGAEKALFRALKTKGNTPKYGLLYHSSFIGRASQGDKGKISRFLANKCSMATRIDAFYPYVTEAFGKRMRDQVEERLEYFKTGERGPPNDEVMHEVLQELKEEHPEELPKKKKKSKEPEDSEEELPKKKKKSETPKKKKSKEPEDSEEETPKKKKKSETPKKKKKSSDSEETPKQKKGKKKSK